MSGKKRGRITAISPIRRERLDSKVTKLHHMGGVAGYEGLERVLSLAFDQAARGKGADRHAAGRGFEDQPIITIPVSKSFLVGLGGLSYQVEKKNGEADRMCEKADEHARLSSDDSLAADTLFAARKEMLGVIVYAAAKILHIERELARVENYEADLEPASEDNDED